VCDDRKAKGPLAIFMGCNVPQILVGRLLLLPERGVRELEVQPPSERVPSVFAAYILPLNIWECETLRKTCSAVEDLLEPGRVASALRRVSGPRTILLNIASHSTNWMSLEFSTAASHAAVLLYKLIHILFFICQTRSVSVFHAEQYAVDLHLRAHTHTLCDRLRRWRGRPRWRASGRHGDDRFASLELRR
jgi:hypothetical protein